MSKLTISRDQGWADSFRNYAIVLNGQIVGKISQGEELTLNLEQGNCELYAKIDWCRSNKLNFSVRDSDDEKRIVIKSSLRGLAIFLGIIYVFFLPSKYLKAEEL
jgi:hypothetical protein